MNSTQRRTLTTIMMASIFLLGLFISLTLDSDFGRLEVKVVSIVDGNKEFRGLMYRPSSAASTNPSPAVVLAHGIGGSKEMMSGIGLELAKRGFVALCLDLLGHGASEGSVEEGINEPSFGVTSAVHFLRSQSFVNASAIGLVGHSLGGGAVRATFAVDGGIGASVLIAGGLGEIAEGPAYRVLNSTFPKNLLVIVGKYDVLFNLTQLETNELLPAFGTQEEVAPGVVYGNFSSQTARKLVTLGTTHLFEPFDSTAVYEIVAWMENAFNSRAVLIARIDGPQTYLEREAAILMSLVAFLGIVLLAFFPLSHVAGMRPVKIELKEAMNKREHAVLQYWKTFGIWGMLGLALFFPMFLVGFAISFPPLIFGASIAWWMLSVGLTGFFVLVAVHLRFSKMKANPKSALVKAFNVKYLLVAAILFIFMFSAASLLDYLFNINLRIISPMFRGLVSMRRVFAFFEFFPFFLVYFLVEGLYFHAVNNWAWQKRGFLSNVLGWGKTVLGKIGPFVAVICFQYVPLVLLEFWVFAGYVGFLVEFLWLIVPIFVITTTCSWWFYQNTGSVWVGAIFNALIMAWLASAVFPF